MSVAAAKTDAKRRADAARDPAGVSVAAPGASPRHEALSVDEHDARGKAIRDRVPRSSHGAWKRPAKRPDPIALLRASDAERLPDLVPIRYGRMLASPFTFYRGSAAIMAADLAHTPATGHHVQACGDCHLMNFGGFATPERNIIFDLNDFDETAPAPWEWDVKRLVASFVLAGRSIGLSDARAREAAMICSATYRKSIRKFARMNPLEVWYLRLTAAMVLEMLPGGMRKDVEERLDKALDRTGSELDFPKLAGVVGGRATIMDAPPLIFHPEGSRAPEFQDTMSTVLAAYRETLPVDRRTLLDRFRFVDAAIKVVGIGSVGRRCWIALLMSPSNAPLFLQFKEAVASVLEPYAGRSVFPHHGQRVVEGQRLTQPVSDVFLGWVTAPTGRQFYVRQLRDAKVKPLIETFDQDMLEVYARMCGGVLARAHAKASDVAEIGGYLGNGDQFDEAMGDFGIAYANQAERDHAALKAAVRKGQIPIFREED